MRTALLSPDDIVVPEYVDRPYSKVKDDLLRKSIEQGGIHEDIIIMEGSNKLVDGLNRLRIARAIGMPKVPVAFHELPEGRDEDDYIKETRFMVDELRQDLLPSQKASMITELKTRFNMTHGQVSAYLGIAPDSVTNWLAVKSYIEPVVEAMDAGRLTMQAARVFDGLSEKGQKHIWRHHSKELMSESGADAHKTFRKLYPPESHSEFYRAPELVAQRLKRVHGKRTSRTRHNITADEKRRLMSSFELREGELKLAKDEEKQYREEIAASIPILSAIIRTEALWSMVPKEMKPELERFQEIYI